MSPSPAEAPLFDPAAIESLRRVAGDQGSTFIAEMADLFVDETRKSLGDLQVGCSRGDWKGVSRISHSLKSSAATLGLMRLSNACKALELDTKNNTSSSETKALVSTLSHLFELGIPVLKNLA